MISQISFRKAHKKFFMLPSPLIISRGEPHSKQLTVWGGVKNFQLYCTKLYLPESCKSFSFGGGLKFIIFKFNFTVSLLKDEEKNYSKIAETKSI